MKPLQALAMGFVVIVLVARLGEYDALPDPVGWLLVLLGVRALPPSVPHQSPLLALGALAGAVAAVLWLPALGDRLLAADPALGWAVNLPQLCFTALLCHALGAAAAAASDRRAARWLRTTLSVLVVVGLLPVLVFGAGFSTLETTSYVAAGAGAVLLIWLLFAYASRPWATRVVPEPVPVP